MREDATDATSTLSGAHIDRDQIRATEATIRPHIRCTPVIAIDGVEIGLPDAGPIHLKLELLQHAGSFKARGAFANLLLRSVPAAGVVAASGGNHGAAVAFAAMKLGVPATVFVPTISSRAKVDRIRSYGAELIVGGAGYAEALAASEEWGARRGALPIHAFDQEETILGQGTLALELERQVPDLDTILVAVGGGGLIAGMASWYGSGVRVIGVEPEGAPTLTRALAAGRPVDAETTSIAADSLAPRRVGERVFPIARQLVDEVVLVTDDAIRQAQDALWRLLRVVAEPGGAAAFAALFSGRYQPRNGERVGVVVSGGNTVAVDFGRQSV
jgi:threonine dehydratase